MTQVRFYRTSPKCIFIALSKKAGATECELYRIISVMSQITKIQNVGQMTDALKVIKDPDVWKVMIAYTGYYLITITIIANPFDKGHRLSTHIKVINS